MKDRRKKLGEKAKKSPKLRHLLAGGDDKRVNRTCEANDDRSTQQMSWAGSEGR